LFARGGWRLLEPQPGTGFVRALSTGVFDRHVVDTHALIDCNKISYNYECLTAGFGTKLDVAGMSVVVKIGDDAR
jgi:hypothetical protein